MLKHAARRHVSANASRARAAPAPTLSAARTRLLSSRSGPLLANVHALASVRHTSPSLPHARAFSWSWWPASSSPSDLAAVPPSPPAAPVSTSNAPAPSTSTEVLQTPPPPPASVEVAAVAPASDSASALAAAVEAPAAATESVTNAATTLVDAAAPVLPFQWADLAALGLDTGFPVGTMTKVLAGTHLATGLPWAASIALAALMLRIPVAALQLFSLRRSAPLQLVSKEMEALRRELHAAEARRDVPAERTATVKMQILAQNAGVSLGPTAVVAPIVFGIGGVVLQLGMYNAVWRVCKANIPEFAAHAGAWGWLPDVAAVDPTYMLPLANFCAIQLAIHFSLRDAASTAQANFMNIFRVLSVPMVLYLSTQTIGVNVYVLVGSILQASQAQVLRLPSVRRALGIPLLPPPSARITPPSILQSFRDSRDAVVQRAENYAEGQVQKQSQHYKVPSAVHAPTRPASVVSTTNKPVRPSKRTAPNTKKGGGR